MYKPHRTNTVATLLTAITGITEAESDFIVRISNDFRVDFDDLDLPWFPDDTAYCNHVISDIYECAIEGCGIDSDRVEANVNSVASRLYVDGDLITTYEELQDKIQND